MATEDDMHSDADRDMELGDVEGGGETTSGAGAPTIVTTRSTREGTRETRREKGAPPVVDEADGVLDELQAWYLGKAEREGWVYTSALRQLVNRMYRDRDYLARRPSRASARPTITRSSATRWRSPGRFAWSCGMFRVRRSAKPSRPRSRASRRGACRSGSERSMRASRVGMASQCGAGTGSSCRRPTCREQQIGEEDGGRRPLRGAYSPRRRGLRTGPPAARAWRRT